MLMNALQRRAVGDGIAQDDDVRSQERIVIGGGGVEEFEAVGAGAGVDVENERLIKVLEDGEGDVGASIAAAS